MHLETECFSQGPVWPVAKSGCLLKNALPSTYPAQGYGIIFYGDSITETLKGTDKCRDCTQDLSTRRSSCAGGPQALSKYFGAYRPGVMGMSMDESAHLLYRLQNGHIPKVNKVQWHGLSARQGALCLLACLAVAHSGGALVACLPTSADIET